MKYLAFILWCAVILPPLAHGDLYHFEATLTGDQAVPPVETNKSGSAEMVYDDATRTFSLSVTFANLTIFSFSPTGFHFHEGPVGETGKVYVGLTFYGEMVTEFDGTITGYEGTDIFLPEQTQLDLNDPHEMLITGNSYLQVHTGEHVAGEIRGQVLLKEVVPVRSSTWGSLKEIFLSP